ncbi:UDP-glucosyltransferase 2-like [Portunus trituberculatus]|uniref:UDP-glucosyltransferase 2-like n=1 Tax=Portunus trituberculatus TaxID=210409 RepID=UPI001E1D09F7|nr:UDP-glucosyltransferase 2-like [Portunus trituberculatus]
MQHARLALPALLALLALLAALLPGAAAADILMLTPFGSRSVRGLFGALTEGLTARGHAVTLLTSGEAPCPHANVTHVRAPHSSLDQMDLFEVRRDAAAFRLWLRALPSVARRLYEDPAVMALWRRRHHFDAIIINSAANEMAFPFLLGVSAPFITLAPAGTEPLQLSYLGNMVSPAALPSVVVPYHDTLSLWERLVNTLATGVLRAYFWRSVGRPLTAALRDTFPDLPDPHQVYPRQALALINRHHLLDGALPLLPNQVEVGCLACRPAHTQALPQDVSAWLEGAGESGVVYFSLGSFQDSSTIPQEYLDILVNAFGQLPHRFLLKLSGHTRKLPSNVRVFEWLPQQDVLGHPSVRAFVTHCGKHSAAESIYHGVPMVGLPITFDQPRTCARLARRGEGVVLQWEALTVEGVIKAVKEVTENQRYSERVKAVSARLKAQKETAMERAVWWIEYVTKYDDSFLKFSGKDLSLGQYLLLDVLAILLCVMLLTAAVVFLLCRLLYRRLWLRLWPWGGGKTKAE